MFLFTSCYQVIVASQVVIYPLTVTPMRYFTDRNCTYYVKVGFILLIWEWIGIYAFQICIIFIWSPYEKLVVSANHYQHNLITIMNFDAGNITLHCYLTQSGEQMFHSTSTYLLVKQFRLTLAQPVKPVPFPDRESRHTNVVKLLMAYLLVHRADLEWTLLFFYIWG